MEANYFPCFEQTDSQYNPLIINKKCPVYQSHLEIFI